MRDVVVPVAVHVRKASSSSNHTAIRVKYLAEDNIYFIGQATAAATYFTLTTVWLLLIETIVA